jgi:rod shape-determining protein MreC
VSIELAPKVKEGRMILILIPLLILHLTLISLQIEEPKGTILLKRWVLVAITPFLDISSTISRAVTGGWRNYVWLHGARNENEQLHDAVSQLSLRERSLQEAQLENQRLQRLLDFRDSHSLETLGAHVVGRVPGFLSNVTYVDRGTESGVLVDQPVVSDAGIVGRIILPARSHSQIQLITNPDASVGVMVERTRTPGVLRGTGNPLLELNYISNTEQVNPGDVVVTSGLDGIFPKGMLVGKVVESRKGKSVFRAIQVEPFVDLLRIENVLILRNYPRGRD